MNKYKSYIIAKINRQIDNTLEEWIVKVYEKYKLIIEQTKAEEVNYILVNKLRDRYFRDLYKVIPKDYKEKVDNELSDINGPSTFVTKKWKALSFANMMKNDYKVLDFWFI